MTVIIDRVLLRKSCSENMQQIYSKIPVPKCDFNEVAPMPKCNFKAFCKY